MSKNFRIFLSSTFGDFQAEREAMNERLWPVLEDRCRAHGAAFEVVDLRWGVSEADGLSHDTLRICLDEVAACRLLSPRPNFVMLIGDRYGWRPLPADIPAVEFETMLATLTNPSERDLLQTWYRRDNNAVPPHHCLMPRDGEYRDNAAWGKVESQLIQLLRKAALAASPAGLTAEKLERYFLSATHLEIVKGTLRAPDAPEHVFSCFRDIDGLETGKGGPVVRFTDLLNGQLAPDARILRSELRKEIRDVLPASHCFNYRCNWTGEASAPISTAHIDTLCADLEGSLLSLIDQELKAETADALDQEIARHTQFAADHTQGFIGRVAELAQLLDWADTALSSPPAGSHPVIVHALGGAGKSSFMAKGVEEIKARHPHAVIITRFIGITPDSIELTGFMRGLLRELARRYGQPEDLPEGELKELIDALPARLAWVTPDKPLLLVIDALDQFTPSMEAREHRWLPVEMPPCVALMLSVLDGKVQEASMRRLPQATRIALPAFTREEGGSLLDALLQAGEAVAPERKRRLTQVQRQTVLDAFHHDGRPLYLVLAAGIARCWHSWQEPQDLPHSTEALVEDIVHRLHDTHGKAIADRALDYLSASRYGVSDTEMRNLLWHDPEARAEFDRRKNPDQPEVNSLPPIIWSRLHSELASWLTEQNVDDVLVHRFFHRIIGEEVVRVSLADDAHVIHGRLADYFGSQPLHLGAGKERKPNLRRLMEQPWQLIKAERLEEAEALITDFKFAMAKCEADRFDDYFENLQFLKQTLQSKGQKISDKLAIWNSFFSERKHILRRGNDEWPAHKILLQLAVEHADDSPMTIAAEAWLKEGHCDWVWMRNIHRPQQMPHNPCIAVLEGHRGLVLGALELEDGSIVSWSDDSTIRIWDAVDGSEKMVLEGHTSKVIGVKSLPNSRILSWSEDGTLRIWDAKSSSELVVLKGHDSAVIGAILLPSGKIVSWSLDKNLLLWDWVTKNTPEARLVGHTDYIRDVKLLHDNRIISWSSDKTLILWCAITGAQLDVIEGHTEAVCGAEILTNGNILSWSDFGRFRVWNGITNHGIGFSDCDIPLDDLDYWEHIEYCIAEDNILSDAVIFPNGFVVLWSSNDMLRIWNSKVINDIKVLEGRTSRINGIIKINNDLILSWSNDGAMFIWDINNSSKISLKGHTDSVEGAHILQDGSIITWSNDKTIRIWDATGKPIKVISNVSRSAFSVEVLSDDHILSYDNGRTNDQVVKVWSLTADIGPIVLKGHADRLRDAILLSSSYILTFSFSDKDSPRLWNTNASKLNYSPIKHNENIIGAQVLDDERILSWNDDQKFRILSCVDGNEIAVFDQPDKGIAWVKMLSDKLIVLCAKDNKIHLLDGITFCKKGVFTKHTDTASVDGVELLPNGTILSWLSYPEDKILRIWNPNTGEDSILDTHTLSGFKVESNGHMLTWSNDSMIRIISCIDGSEIAAVTVHDGSIQDAKILSDNLIVLKLNNKRLRLWDIKNNKIVALNENTLSANNVKLVSEDGILSWGKRHHFKVLSEDNRLSLWNNGETKFLKKHYRPVISAEILLDNKILSWSLNDICVWSADGEIEYYYGRDSKGVVIYSSEYAFNIAKITPKLSMALSNLVFEKPICWHHDTSNPVVLYSNVTYRYVARTITNELMWLQLYSGNMPIYN